jgi:hypothetical protein
MRNNIILQQKQIINTTENKDKNYIEIQVEISLVN